MKNFLFIALAAVTMAACGKGGDNNGPDNNGSNNNGSDGGNVSVTGVTLDQTSETLAIGGSLQLTATVAPDNATDKTVTWSSGAPNVASVDANGLVSAVAMGSATITVTTKDGGKKAVCELEVTLPLKLTSISVATPPDKMSYGINEPFDPTGMVVKANYDNGTSTPVSVGASNFTYDFSMWGPGKTVTITVDGKTAVVTGISVLMLADRIKAALGTTATIILYADESIGNNIISTNNTLSSGTKLTLEGSGAVRTISHLSVGALFYIAPDATLTLDENLTIDGKGVSNNEALITLTGFGSVLNMKNGTKLTGNNLTVGVGGAVIVIGGTFNMEGGTITGNSATATIGQGGGGGVYVAQAGIFNMTGGSVSGNNATVGRGQDIFADSGLPGGGLIQLSGAAQIGNIALSSNISTSGEINLTAPFTGAIGSIDLLSPVPALSTVINYWTNMSTPVVVANADITLDVAKFPLGKFYNNDGSQSQAITPSYKLDATGELVVAP